MHVVTPRAPIVALLLVAAACGGPAGPAALDPRHDACAWCRMTVSDRHFASQVVAPSEEPRFFDDLGCLAGWLRENRFPDGALVFVADHRTGEWVDARRAVFARAPGLATPMGSNLVAHADTASRAADAAAAGAEDVPPSEVLGP